jgi:hypothetical protein
MAGSAGDHARMLRSGRWKEAVQAYLATIAYCDAQIGRLLDALEQSLYRENTIVVLWGDHGWHLGEKEHWRKFALWEEATRVPYIWVVPSVTTPGGVCDRTVDLMSIYPTLCALCGLAPPMHVEGEDITPLLADPQSKWDRPAATTFRRNNHTVRTEKWRYIRYADGGEELYDHEHDQYEWTNLAGDERFTDVKDELKNLLPTTNKPELSHPARAAQAGVGAARRRRTEVDIRDGRWHLNGEVTYRDTKAEGLLINVRMVNATFEDRRRADFDADANTERFLNHLPDYHAHGVRAITLNLQGGAPGYEGALNSAFKADGSLRPRYLRRVARVIDACDRQGVAVILGCFYQRQDQVLQDDGAVRAGVVNAVNWIEERGFTNVLLEIANEFPHGGFDREILKTPVGQVELIELARKTNPRLLVSTSGLGGGRLPAQVCEASDFLLIHFNGTAVKDIPARIGALRKYNKPIVCNEDDKIGSEAAQAARVSVENGASWGLMLKQLNQYEPFEFKGAGDDEVVYSKLKELTSPSISKP